MSIHGTFAVPGVQSSAENWAKISAHIKKDLDEKQVKLFDNVRATMTGGSTADVIIDELRALV